MVCYVWSTSVCTFDICNLIKSKVKSVFQYNSFFFVLYTICIPYHPCEDMDSRIFKKYLEQYIVSTHFLYTTT